MNVTIFDFMVSKMFMRSPKLRAHRSGYGLNSETLTILYSILEEVLIVIIFFKKIYI